MSTQELKDLQKNLLGIISTIIIEGDEKEISDMQNQALEIIGNEDFRKHINDEINGYTILDSINKCSERVSKDFTEKRGLAEIERAVKSAGGKTSEELGRHSSLNNLHEENEVQLIVSPILSTYQMLGVYSMASMSTRLGAIFTSDGQVQRVGGVGTILGVTLGGLLSMPIIFMLPASIASMQINRNSEHRVPTREVAQRYLDLVGESRVGLSAALGAGLTAILLRIGFTPLTFRGGVTFSGVNIEFGGSLRSGLIAAAGAGIGATLSMALMRRMFAPISTNLENVATEQQNIQPEQGR